MKKEQNDKIEYTSRSETEAMGEKAALKRRRTSGASKKKKSPVRKTLSVIGTTFLSLFLILVITGSVVATALTIYIMNYADSSVVNIDLRNLKISYTSILYGYNDAGEEVELVRLADDSNRIWIDITEIPQIVQDAFVYSEDERFLTHDGVDWKRTVGAFVNMFVDIYGSQQGGSTITQQLIKNITGDSDVSIPRKIREIFTAMSLERYYSKDDILEAYMNYITLSRGTICGVEAAANYYFGKSIREVDLAEAAVIAGVIQNPNKNDPYYDYAANRGRAEYVLAQMYENGAITTQQYEEALAEEVQFKNSVDRDGDGVDDGTSSAETPEETPADDTGETPDEAAQEAGEEIPTATMNWYEDAVITQVIKDLMEVKGTNFEATKKELYQGGYRIYCYEDIDMQEQLEEKYKDLSLFSLVEYTEDEAKPQGAFIVMDYNGCVRAVVGGIGDKEGDLVFNRAIDATRKPGSAIKPLASYGPSIEYDKITWSTLFWDAPYLINEEGNNWPSNYSKQYSNRNMPVYEALQRSLNTIPVRIISDILMPSVSYDFLTNKLHFTTIVSQEQLENGKVLTDIDKAPLSVGALTHGVRLIELAAGYQMYGNGGYYYEPSLYSKVVDATGKVVLKHNPYGSQVVSSETAWVMNRLLKEVVEGENGTAKKAKLTNVEVVAKTGTTDDFKDAMIVALTPEYVTALWYGFDLEVVMTASMFNSTPVMWKSVFGDIADAGTVTTFTPDPNVLQLAFDLDTGLLAGEFSTHTATGYYKPSNIPRKTTKEDLEKAAEAKPPEPIDLRDQDE